jgi:gamma-glutamyltranspeptidase / glutathione hydrolase
VRNFQLPGRSPVYARNAMCATSHPLASLTAIETLKRGGNAIDAAIAAVAVLGVVEPQMTGIGGDCFALFCRRGGKPTALNASGRAPNAATAAYYAAQGITAISPTTAHAATVPGAVDGWAKLSSEHGRLPFATLLEPAIELAGRGWVVAPRVAADWVNGVAKLSSNAGARKHLLVDGARAPRCGEVMKSPALARTLRAIAKEGRDAFYGGEIAEDMVETLNAAGGLHTLADFASQTSSYVEPVSTHYRGLDVVELPPSNQGIVALIVLKMLARIGPRGADPMDPTRFHLLMEAARLAYAMRDTFVADPDMADVPVAHMLADATIDGLVRRIDMQRRTPGLGLPPPPVGTDTVYLAVVDSDGFAVSFINSLFAQWGCGIVTEKTGINFHSRGAGFTLQPGHPNAIAPGKRPLHTLVPALVMKNGEPYMPFGVMGAAFQPLGHVFVISNMIDYGMDPQEAIDFPRAFIEGGAVWVEDGVPQSVRDQLGKLGHRVELKPEPWGGGQSVVIDRANGVLIGASDPRKDGCALGY